MIDPKELKYSRDDEWLRYDGDDAYVGITDYAQSELGDLVFVNLPEVGDEVVAAIMGALSMMYAGTGKKPVLRGVKASKPRRSAWSSAGAVENTRPF